MTLATYTIVGTIFFCILSIIISTNVYLGIVESDVTSFVIIGGFLFLSFMVWPIMIPVFIFIVAAEFNN